MAVTKTHPIKSTLKAAIDYILNPEKTDGKLLASSFGCGLETADIEFAWTREAAGDRGTHLGRHLIQSFPDFQAAGFSSSRPQSRLAIPRVFFSRFRHGWSLLSTCRHRKRTVDFLGCPFD